MTAKYYEKPSRYTALRTLERFFANKYGNTITKEEIISAWQRDKPHFETKNDKWLYNKLTAIYAYGLATPNYAYDPYKRLISLELTDEGRHALGRSDTISPVTRGRIAGEKPIDGSLTIDGLIEAADKINSRLTSYRVKISLESVGE